MVANNDFARVSYTEAVEIVSKVAGPKEGVAWEFPPKWGEELQTEHEKYLAEEVFKKPVIVYNYPKGCKAFYMRCNDGCEPGKETVAAMDVLFPKVTALCRPQPRGPLALGRIRSGRPCSGRVCSSFERRPGGGHAALEARPLSIWADLLRLLRQLGW